MLRQTAQCRLQELRENIRQFGYDSAPKYVVGVILGDLKTACYRKPGDLNSLDQSLLDNIRALEKRFQDDRLNATGGADTIEEILLAVESHLHLLPTQANNHTVTIPTKAEQDADEILRVLKQRGVGVSVSV